MDIEELKEVLKTDEFKAILDSDEFKDVVIGTKHVQGLAANKDEILEESKQYKQMLAAYKELGDVETLKSAKDFYTKAEQERIAKEGDAKDSAVMAQLKSLQDKLAAMEEEKAQQIERTVKAQKDSFITKAITEAKGEPDLLSHIVGSRVKAEYENDKVKFSILDNEGNDWAIDGKLASIDDLINEVKTKYSRAFDADVVNGTNTRTNNNRKSTKAKLDPKRADFFSNK